MEFTFIQLSCIIIIIIMIILSNINLSLTYGPQQSILQSNASDVHFKLEDLKKTHVYNYGQHNYFKSIVF